MFLVEARRKVKVKVVSPDSNESYPLFLLKMKLNNLFNRLHFKSLKILIFTVYSTNYNNLYFLIK